MIVSAEMAAKGRRLRRGESNRTAALSDHNGSAAEIASRVSGATRLPVKCIRAGRHEAGGN
jgi:hypothetical protein